MHTGQCGLCPGILHRPFSVYTGHINLCTLMLYRPFHTNCAELMLINTNINAFLIELTNFIGKSLNSLNNAYMAITSLLIGISEKFFHCWKAEVMASHYGWCLMALHRPLRFYTGHCRCAGVISATLTPYLFGNKVDVFAVSHGTNKISFLFVCF